jgi:hypothetical protein
MFQRCILPQSSGWWSHDPDDGGSTHLWNVSPLQQDYITLYLRRLSSSYPLLWDPKSHKVLQVQGPLYLLPNLWDIVVPERQSEHGYILFGLCSWHGKKLWETKVWENKCCSFNIGGLLLKNLLCVLTVVQLLDVTLWWLDGSSIENKKIMYVLFHL